MLSDVVMQCIHVESFGVVDSATDVAHTDQTDSLFGQETSRVAADVSESLHDGRTLFETQADVLCRFDDEIDESSTGRFGASQRSAEHDRLARDDFGNRVADLLAVGVHDPGHDLSVRAQVGSRNILVRPDHADDFHRVATGQPLDFRARELRGIDAHAPFGAAEGEVHQGALPGHPHRERRDFAQVDVLVIADPSLGRAHRQDVLDSIPEDGFDIAVVVPAAGEAHHQGPLGEEEAIADVLVELHDFGRLEELLLSQAEHRGVPLGGRGERLIERLDDRRHNRRFLWESRRWGRRSGRPTTNGSVMAIMAVGCRSENGGLGVEENAGRRECVSTRDSNVW